MRALLALVLVVALVPVGMAQAADAWSIEATFVLTDATHATLVDKITHDEPTRWSLLVPRGGTFLDAKGPTGNVLEASVADGKVSVTTPGGAGYFFTLRYALTPTQDGPFTLAQVDVGAASDSPVTIRASLPEGWRIAGWRDHGEDAPPTAAGTWTKTGPALVEYALLPPDAPDVPADLSVSDRIVKRVANATVSTMGVRVELEQTYDTGVYSRNWSMPLPEGATDVSAHSPFGPIPVQLSGSEAHLTTPYPTGYHLGARAFTIAYTTPAPDMHGGAFQRANVSVRAQADDDVWLRVAFAEGLTPTGASTSGAIEEAPWTFHAREPISVGAAFLPPVAAGHVRFTEGPFVVDAPAVHEKGARATALNASQLLPAAASFAIAGPIERPFFVAFTEADVFSWEEGFYSNGLNTISIRASTLVNASDGLPHKEPVGVLVHEATHGLLDRLMPDAPHNVSFLHEGLSRLAETRVEAAFADQVFVCNKQRTECVRESARPSPEELRDYHLAGRVFDPAWSASTAATGERSFLYDYSGLVMHHYDTRAPAGALAAALVNISRQSLDDAQAADAVVDTLLAYAPGTTRDALLYPGRAAAALPVDEFRYCMRGFVAPPYPWQPQGSAPAGGCPAAGFGPGDAALPPLPPAPSPERVPTPSPVAPTELPPEPTSVPADATSRPEGEAPAAVAQPTAGVPGVAPLALVALVAALALLRRR